MIFLTISVRFLDPRFHGRADGGLPEWPPSPMRVFQAMVAAAASVGRGHVPDDDARAALEWLERLTDAVAPVIVAPPTLPLGAGYVLSVPNNALDLVGAAWSRGNYSMSGDADPARHRAMKLVRPTRFRDGDTIHVLFPMGNVLTLSDAAHIEHLKQLARHVVALGWGIDLVVTHASVLNEQEAVALPGERWLPGSTRRQALRVPVSGSLEALEARHRGFLDRIHGDVWRSPPAFTRFRRVGYYRQDAPEPRAFAAFALRQVNDCMRFRSFDPVLETSSIAGRVRHAAYEAALVSKAGEWPDAHIASFILGHGEAGVGTRAPPCPRRFAYLPMPTIHARGPAGEQVGAVRRVLVTTFADDCDGEVAWAEQVLAGREIVDEGTGRPAAVLEPLATSDSVLARFMPADGASTWASVTPVLLPGHDDPRCVRKQLAKGVGAPEQRRLVGLLERRVDELLRKAIMHTGITADLAARALLSWQGPSFLPGVQHARRYRVPKHLGRYPALHVRIEWRDAAGLPVAIPGPVCIGSGRFYGLGLFAAMR